MGVTRRAWMRIATALGLPMLTAASPPNRIGCLPVDEIVASVLERRINAGFVRSGVLEALAAEGRLRMDDVRVID